jgi:hypothetical protein
MAKETSEKGCFDRFLVIIQKHGRFSKLTAEGRFARGVVEEVGDSDLLVRPRPSADTVGRWVAERSLSRRGEDCQQVGDRELTQSERRGLSTDGWLRAHSVGEARTVSKWVTERSLSRRGEDCQQMGGRELTQSERRGLSASGWLRGH